MDSYLYFWTSVYLPLISSSTCSVCLYMNVPIFFLHVGNIPFRRPEVTVSSWTRVPNYVWGMISLLVVYMTRCPFHVNMKSNVLFSGCFKHAQRRRICLILLWSWAFPSRNSTLCCCELLCFWLVSPLLPPFSIAYWRRILWNVVYYTHSYLLWILGWRSLCQRNIRKGPKHLY